MNAAAICDITQPWLPRFVGDVPDRAGIARQQGSVVVQLAEPLRTVLPLAPFNGTEAGLASLDPVSRAGIARQPDPAVVHVAPTALRNHALAPLDAAQRLRLVPESSDRAGVTVLPHALVVHRTPTRCLNRPFTPVGVLATLLPIHDPTLCHLSDRRPHANPTTEVHLRHQRLIQAR